MLTRRFFNLIALLVVFVMLASCASPATPTAQPAAPTSAPAQSTTAPASATKLDLNGCKQTNLTTDNISLRFLRQVYGDPQEAYLKDIYAQWNAVYPNIKIQEETVPFGELFTKVQISAASGDAPDIMMGQGDFTRNYVFGNLALPLNDYLTDEYVNDYFPALKDMATVDGKVYLFPYDLQASSMAFNKDMWTKAGLSDPPQSADSNDTWTWEQWRDQLRKLKTYLDQNGPQGVWALAPSTFGGGGPGSNYWHEGILIRSYGDPNAPKDSTKYKTWAGISEDGLTTTGYVDTPEAIEAMKLYQSLFTEKLSPSAGMANAWLDEKAVTDWAGSGIWTFAKVYGVKFQPGVAANPKGAVQFTHVSGDSPFISSKTKNPAEAAAFLCFLTNNPNRIKWDEVWGAMPARQSVMQQLPKFKEFPFNMFADTVFKHGAPAPKTPGTLEYETAMNGAIRDIALGADPAERLHQVAQEIDAQLVKYKK